jgi:hypothetical protein
MDNIAFYKARIERSAMRLRMPMTENARISAQRGSPWSWGVATDVEMEHGIEGILLYPFMACTER